MSTFVKDSKPRPPPSKPPLSLGSAIEKKKNWSPLIGKNDRSEVQEFFCWRRQQQQLKFSSSIHKGSHAVSAFWGLALCGLQDQANGAWNIDTDFCWRDETGGGFKHFFWILIPKIGEMIQIDETIFQMGWNHQLEILFPFSLLSFIEFFSVCAGNFLKGPVCLVPLSLAEQCDCNATLDTLLSRVSRNQRLNHPALKCRHS